MDLAIHHAVAKSRYHRNNEDSLFIGSNFIIVADGMGGECNGDVASKIAVNTISNYIYANLNIDCGTDLKKIMFSAIELADSEIVEYVDAHPDSDGMGTTVLIMIYHNGVVSLAWCGDSHCYSFDKGKLTSLTKDHSYVQELIDAGKISLEDSFSHPDNNLITRYVGGGPSACCPEYVEHKLDVSEVILLCSDGLSGYCRESEINKAVDSNRNPALLPQELMELAVRCGSDDDITIVTFSENYKSSSRRHFPLFNWFHSK